MAGSSRIRRGVALAVGALCVGVVGCTVVPSQPGNHYSTPPAPKASEAPFTPYTTALTFDGSTAAPFEDPTTTDERSTGRYSMGRWMANNGAYEQTQELDAATLMFQRYNGDGFGHPNGMAPSRYSFEATAFAYKPVTASESVMAGAPVGILAVVPYYLDSTHYILVEAAKDRYQAWFVDGLTPGDEWSADTYMRYDEQATGSLDVNQPVKFKIDMDTKAGTMRLSINDELKDVITDKKFIKDVQHSVALLSNGNYAAFKDVKLTPESAH